MRRGGLIAAFELIAPKRWDSNFVAGKLGAMMNTIMLNNGLISHTIPDAIAFCPPLILTSAEVTKNDRYSGPRSQKTFGRNWMIEGE